MLSKDIFEHNDKIKLWASTNKLLTKKPTLGRQETPLVSVGLYTNLNLHEFNYSARLGAQKAGRLQSNSKVWPMISEQKCVIVDIEH